jgi:hypothetical protein
MTDETIGAAEAVTERKPYATVNGAWPAKQNELPKLTEDEAIAAVKRLLRFAKVTFRGSFRIGTGRRYTWPRAGVYTVNAERGWHSLVHDVSHWCHRRLRPGKRPHDFRHAMLEREMIQHVVSSGWLDGKLRKPVAQKPTANDRQRNKLAGILERIKRWEQKERRAQTALAKLAKQRRYYERQLAV